LAEFRAFTSVTKTAWGKIMGYASAVPSQWKIALENKHRARGMLEATARCTGGGTFFTNRFGDAARSLSYMPAPSDMRKSPVFSVSDAYRY
jgi:hypothetical protein